LKYDDVLSHREARVELIQSYLIGRSKRKVVITIKSNTPGENKNVVEAYLLVRIFKNILLKRLKPNDTYYDEGPDGPMFMMAFRSGNPIEYKKDMIDIENEHPLGRFIDIDVFELKEFSISRMDLDQQPRKCYLCDKDAVLCARDMTHSYHDLMHHVKKHLLAYITKEIERIMDQAMMAELNLENKFGLVTKTSSGSHADMNFDVMIKAKQAILPYLIKLFERGYNGKYLETLLELTRDIGIQAEQAMMRATGGINAYKGLIFVLGNFALATGYTLSHGEEIGNTFYNIKMICHNIMKDFERPLSTAGYEAYVNHQIFGVRGEAHQGFPSVRNTMMLVQGIEITDDLLRRVLKDLILMTDDTVLLKRAGSIGNYYRIKEMVKKVNMKDIEEVQTFTRYAIKNNLSFGGSADLLIAVVYMKLFQDTFY
jgi:holo-ACP synthase / triphosphoribosyl-dephospho-CoA synthase